MISRNDKTNRENHLFRLQFYRKIDKLIRKHANKIQTKITQTFFSNKNKY